MATRSAKPRRVALKGSRKAPVKEGRCVGPVRKDERRLGSVHGAWQPGWRDPPQTALALVVQRVDIDQLPEPAHP